jgi:hypothetical protein
MIIFLIRQWSNITQKVNGDNNLNAEGVKVNN